MKIVKRVIRRLNFEAGRVPARTREWMLSRVSEQQLFRRGMISMPASLRNMQRNGFRPGSIIDVGAYQGDWSRMARRIFPEAPIYMFEANEDKDPILAATCQEIGGAKHRIALMGPRASEMVDFYVMETGSSVLSENTAMPRSSRRLPTNTLDNLLFETGPPPGPYFIKLDVQGFELEVLRGADRVLGNTEVAQLEVALLPYNQGAPLLAEVVAFMLARGFLAYDVCGFYRRESDDALYMVDLLFVREGSSLRSKKPFWNLESQFEATR
jgi:FkbM family methyltransferase